MDEMAEDNRRILNGQEPIAGSVNEVRELPQSFRSWTEANANRIAVATRRGTLPHFLRDNEKLIKYDTAIYQPTKLPYTFNIDDLNSKGYYIRMDRPSDAVKTYDEIIKGFDIPEFDNELESIMSKHGITINNKYLDIIGRKITIEYRTEQNGDNTYDFRLIRSFFINEDGDRTVDHDRFTLADEFQNKGISKELFRALYKQYKNANIENIDVHANLKVGGYTWGRYGYYAINNEWNIDEIKYWAKSQLGKKQIDADDYADFERYG
jgi:GNAT superfamily N-acetyltransferase